MTVVDTDGKPLPVKGALLQLTPLGPQPVTPQPAGGQHIVDMQNKTYVPRYTTVAAGDTLRFVNSDLIQHNVFSSTGKSAFDLGTFGGGLSRQVRLLAPGVVKVYCNIHPQMAAFVQVAEGGYSAVADHEQGRYRLLDLPLGSYELRVWHIRGQLVQQVEIDRAGTQRLDVTVSGDDIDLEPHLNKLGQPYRRNTALFADEFY